MHLCFEGIILLCLTSLESRIRWMAKNLRYVSVCSSDRKQILHAFILFTDMISDNCKACKVMFCLQI